MSSSSIDTIVPGEPLSAPLRTAGYLVLALAAFYPLLDTFAALAPFNFGNATWRFGAVGLISNAVMGLSLELFLLAVVAVLSNHRRVLLVIAVVCLVVAILLLGSSLLFTLDALQTRSKVNVTMMRRFEFASLVALSKLVLYAVVNLILARGAMLMAKRRASKPTTRTRGLVSPVVKAPGAPVDGPRAGETGVV